MVGSTFLPGYTYPCPIKWGTEGLAIASQTETDDVCGYLLGKQKLIMSTGGTWHELVNTRIDWKTFDLARASFPQRYSSNA